MNKTKILSIILTLCMTVSLFAVAMVSASASDNTEEGTSVEATEATEEASAEAPTEPATEAATEPATEADEKNDSKWRGTLTASLNLTGEESVIFTRANGGLKKEDLTFIPMDVVAVQTSSGKTYAYLTAIFDSCKSEKEDLERKKKAWGDSIYSDPEIMEEYTEAQKEYFEKLADAVTWWVYTVNVNSAGNSALVGKVRIDFDDIKTSDRSSDGWIVTSKEPDPKKIEKISSEAKNAIANYNDIDLKIIAQIAEKKLNNKSDFMFMCYGTKDSKTDLYVVEVHETDTAPEITKVSMLDLSAYTLATENNNNNNNNPNANGNGNENVNNNNGANGGSGSALVFPSTGSDYTIVYCAIALLVVSSAVIIFARKKKHN